MPKAKPKTPKTEKMWMAWNDVDGFWPSDWGTKKKDVEGLTGEGVPVRIVPEAEYQRMRQAANHIPDTNKMVKEG